MKAALIAAAAAQLTLTGSLAPALYAQVASAL